MEEAEVADRIALIDSGRIVALGTPRELKARSAAGIVSLRRTTTRARGPGCGSTGFVPEPGGQGITLVHPDPPRSSPTSSATSP
jgi:ABC-type multidrug transport system ATPase subunit